MIEIKVLNDTHFELPHYLKYIAYKGNNNNKNMIHLKKKYNSITNEKLILVFLVRRKSDIPMYDYQIQTLDFE